MFGHVSQRGGGCFLFLPPKTRLAYSKSPEKETNCNTTKLVSEKTSSSQAKRKMTAKTCWRFTLCWVWPENERWNSLPLVERREKNKLTVKTLWWVVATLRKDPGVLVGSRQEILSQHSAEKKIKCQELLERNKNWKLMVLFKAL